MLMYDIPIRATQIIEPKHLRSLSDSEAISFGKITDNFKFRRVKEIESTAIATNYTSTTVPNFIACNFNSIVIYSEVVIADLNAAGDLGMTTLQHVLTA